MCAVCSDLVVMVSLTDNKERRPAHVQTGTARSLCRFVPKSCLGIGRVLEGAGVGNYNITCSKRVTRVQLQHNML